MNSGKRFLSMLLSAMILVSSLPFGALAEEAEPAEETIIVEAAEDIQQETGPEEFTEEETGEADEEESEEAPTEEAVEEEPEILEEEPTEETPAPAGELNEAEEPVEEPVSEPTAEPASEPTEEPSEEPTETPTEAPTPEPEEEEILEAEEETVSEEAKDDGTTNGFNWRPIAENGVTIGVEIKSYNGSGDVNIPSKITSGSKDYPILSIASNAFMNRTDINTVIVPDSVKTIKSGAFAGSSIKSITLSKNITSVDNILFKGCVNLESITIPDSVTSIGDSAFEGSGLKSVVFSKNLTSISYNLFKDCKNLESITIPDNITSIADNAFEGSGLKSVVLSKKLTSLGNELFKNCTNLESITIPDSVTSIGNSAFEGSGLKSVKLPNNLKSLSASLFKNCTNLESITIPNSVTDIGNYAFEGSGLKSVVLSNSLTSLSYKLFLNCKNLESIIIPDSVTSIDESVFEGSGLKSAELPNNLKSLSTSLFKNCTNLESITIPNSVTDIGNYAFEGSGIRYLVIPNSVLGIGYKTFKNCKNLESIIISESVKNIAIYAFEECTNLESVTVLSHDVSYEISLGEAHLDNVFYNCPKLTIYGKSGSTTQEYATGNGIPFSSFIENDDKTITITGYSGSGDVVIPSDIAGKQVTAIDEFAFDENKDITSVVIPDTVTSIGDYAFFGCNNIETLELPEALTDIGVKAFWGCKKIADENGLVTVNNIVFDFAFGEKEEMQDVVIPSTVTTIGEEAFFGVKNLSSVTVPKSVNSIENNAFKNSENLTVYLDCLSTLERDSYGATSIAWVTDHKITYTWSEDGKTCTAKANCSCDKVSHEDLEAEAICTIRKASSEKDGAEVYTASFDFNGETYTSTKETVIPKIVVTAPKARTLTYTGSSQSLITAGKTTGGTMQYSTDGKTYSTGLPKKTSAGTYKVYYKVVGNSNYNSTSAKYITVIIKKATPKVTAPTAKTLAYTGSAQTLVTAGKTTGGTMQYSTDGKTYSTGLPKKTSVGIYKVYYKVVGNTNYNSVSAKYITVKIAPKKAVISSYANTSTGIKLTWGKVTGATGYAVYRDGVKIKTTTATSYTDISDTVAKAANGKAFKYTVKAYYKNSAGTYAYGAASTAKTAYRVKAPATFTATAGTGYIKLTFSKVPTGMNYQIYRATSKTGTYSLIKTVSAGATYYKNTGLTKGKTYYYKVRAYKTIGSTKVYSAYTAVKYATVK